MVKNVYAPKFSDMPEIIPIFPLASVLLLPAGHLPLNIFEPRYIAMIEAALAGSRMIGMVLPKDKKNADNQPHIYDIGCAGKIVEFSETPDGRYLISLHGISRFKIKKELQTHQGFRRVEACWDDFKGDLDGPNCRDLDRSRMRELLREYFKAEDLTCDWERIKSVPDAELITCLSMICPFPVKEKQALLEAGCCNARAELFTTLLEIAVASAECTYQTQ